MTDYSSFILKIRVDERRNVLMGTIQHVATQDRLRFREMGRMLQFIFAHVSPENDDPVTVTQTREHEQTVEREQA